MRCFGYYIIRPLPKPAYCTLGSSHMLSVCIDGLSEIFPALDKCFYINYPESHRQEYRNYLKLGDGEFEELKKDVAGLFDSKRLATDGRFCDTDDCLKLYRYLKNVDGYRIVGLYTDPGIFSEYQKEGTFDVISSGKTSDLPKRLIGCDILGSESLEPGYSSFTGYIACSLNEVIDERSSVKLITDPKTGLIQNSYEETVRFCDLIQGEGEPVIWTPFEVYDLTPDPRLH